MKKWFFLLLILTALNGCQLTRVEGQVDDVDFKVNKQDDTRHGGKFCPPGQAKKGNC